MVSGKILRRRCLEEILEAVKHKGITMTSCLLSEDKNDAKASGYVNNSARRKLQHYKKHDIPYSIEVSVKNVSTMGIGQHEFNIGKAEDPKYDAKIKKYDLEIKKYENDIKHLNDEVNRINKEKKTKWDIFIPKSIWSEEIAKEYGLDKIDTAAVLNSKYYARYGEDAPFIHHDGIVRYSIAETTKNGYDFVFRGSKSEAQLKKHFVWKAAIAMYDAEVERLKENVEENLFQAESAKPTLENQGIAQYEPIEEEKLKCRPDEPEKILDVCVRIGPSQKTQTFVIKELMPEK